MFGAPWRVDSARVLHNVVANGHVLFLDFVGLEKGDLKSVDVPELICEDSKQTYRVSECCSETEIEMILGLAKRQMRVMLLGEERPQCHVVLAAFARLSHVRTFLVPEELARVFFGRVRLLHIPRYDLPHIIM
jgi:hypothetical protein